MIYLFIYLFFLLEVVIIYWLLNAEVQGSLGQGPCSACKLHSFVFLLNPSVCARLRHSFCGAAVSLPKRQAAFPEGHKR